MEMLARSREIVSAIALLLFGFALVGLLVIGAAWHHAAVALHLAAAHPSGGMRDMWE